MGRGSRLLALDDLRARPLIVDAAAAVALTIVGLLSARTAIDAGGLTAEPPATVVWVVLTAALMLPLALRRTMPLATLLIVTAVFFPYRLLDVPDLSVSVVAWWLALYSAGAYGAARWRDPARLVNVICTIGFISYRLIAPGGELAAGAALARSGFLLMLNALFIISAWSFGNTTAARRAGELALAEQAVALERVRIARELHDVVAHHVSVMGVQATAAARVMDHDQPAARSALASIAQTSRTAVRELQQLLAFLRPSNGSPRDDRRSRATLRQLDQLVAEVRTAGLDVDLAVTGKLDNLPDSIDVSAFRIVQEALTNVIKHANAARATVSINRAKERLCISVVDDGTGASTLLTTAGRHGVVGMRERVSLHGGKLEIGPTASGGFHVTATLPAREPTK